MVAREGARDFFDLDITLEVHDLKHLNEIMASLRGKHCGERREPHDRIGDDADTRRRSG